MSIARFTWTRPDDQRDLGYIQLAAHGEYVKFTDYDSREGELLSECDRLRAGLEGVTECEDLDTALVIARKALTGGQ